MPDDTNETAAGEPTASQAVPVPRTPSRQLLVRVGIAVAAIAVLVLACAVLKPSVTFRGLQKPLAEMSNAERKAFAEKIKAKVARNMLMPEEVPEVILASDKFAALLAEGPFWRNLDRNDLILVFREEPQIIIWRPSKKLIVNVGPIIDNEAGSKEATP